MNTKETPKNTYWRDENGEIRKGLRWAVEANDILVKGFGEDSVYYRGFKPVIIKGKGYLAGVYEVGNANKRPSQEWLNMIANYSSEYIKQVWYSAKSIKDNTGIEYRNVVIFVL